MPGQRHSLVLALAVAVACLTHNAELAALPPLDEIMGLSSGNSVQFNPENPNHEYVARLGYLGHTISDDGDYQY
ncbi:MAG: hypothetical protein CMN04_02130 [Roseibacillus sp.]|nr:hypothetical protein [Roseibacillus sp.]|tara:strand:- start:17803 stop:18024 length:222 start_codon:yes stop_codon:yes gene_type:complete